MTSDHYEGYTYVGKPVPAGWQGATCRLCKTKIEQGCMIIKVAAEGSTTQHGQGPGYWVHARHTPPDQRPMTLWD